MNTKRAIKTTSRIKEIDEYYVVSVDTHDIFDPTQRNLLECLARSCGFKFHTSDTGIFSIHMYVPKNRPSDDVLKAGEWIVDHVTAALACST